MLLQSCHQLLMCQCLSVFVVVAGVLWCLPPVFPSCSDLASNWHIDLASELEEYLQELEHIHISFDQGKTQLNFAEG